MSNQVKQLELDFGLLTVDQQEIVDRFISNRKRNATDASIRAEKIEKLLISGGFISGINYVNSFGIKNVTEDREFGYDDNKFNANVTFIMDYGGCRLITDRYDPEQNKIVTHLVQVGSNYYDKLECSTITPQYRSYKPTSLLVKLQEYNASQLNKLETQSKEKIILDYTVNKYKTLFPNAKITIGTDYNKRGYDYAEFKIVYVTFESGSYVSFRLGYERDQEYTHKKFDAVASKMTVIEILNIFNNQ